MRVSLKSLVIALAVTLISTPAIAQERNPFRYIASMNGHCKKLIIAGQNLTSVCPQKILNVSYKVGRGSFMIPLIAEKGLISFSGSKDAQPSLSRYTLYLDMLNMTGSMFGANPISQDNVGTCELYGNPNNEVSTLKCRAESASGSVSEFEFVTDGTSPDVEKFP